MKITFIKTSGEKTTREISFIDIKEDSVNTEKKLFYFMEDEKFKSCRYENIIKEETDAIINKLINELK